MLVVVVLVVVLVDRGLVAIVPVGCGSSSSAIGSFVVFALLAVVVVVGVVITKEPIVV